MSEDKKERPIPAVIVDIDGTIADPAHRRHFVTTSPKNWKAFFAAVGEDAPITPVINVVKSCRIAGAAIIFVTGRPESTRDDTEKWLKDAAGLEGQFDYEAVFMRQDDDFRSDDIVKEEILDYIIDQGFEPTIVFDDREKVVAMWRRRGLICAQVNEGKF